MDKHVINFAASNHRLEQDVQRVSRAIAQKTKNYRIGILADAHSKPLLESPSSAVYALKDYFALELTSPSPNCGISLLKTDFEKDQLDREEWLSKFTAEFIEAVPQIPTGNRLTGLKLNDVLARGVQPLIETYGMDERVAAHIELQGNVFSGQTITAEDVGEVIPGFISALSQSRFGILGGGNHFLEFQSVHEIYNNEMAEKLKVQPNQALIMFHTGSEAIGSLIGRIYARRKKTTGKMRRRMLPEKIKFHYKNLPAKAALQRMRYFAGGDFNFVPEARAEGRRALMAYHAAFNFGYANRLYISHSIQRILDKSFAGSGNAQLLVDVSHNSIFKEQLQADAYFVHRHNCCRIYPKESFTDDSPFAATGQPIIIPGTNVHSSYLCVPGPNIERSLFSVDHGFGNLLKEENSEHTNDMAAQTTRLFQYGQRGFSVLSLQRDGANLHQLKKMEQEGILIPVARLSPFATLKGPKPKFV